MTSTEQHAIHTTRCYNETCDVCGQTVYLKLGSALRIPNGYRHAACDPTQAWPEVDCFRT